MSKRPKGLMELKLRAAPKPVSVQHRDDDLRPNKDSEAYKQLMYALEHPHYVDVTDLSKEERKRLLLGH